MNDAVGQNGGMENLDGRVAVVTGAGSGIGRAISLALAERGCAMALVDVNQAGLDETGALINTYATTHIADVSDRARMSELPDEVVAQCRRAARTCGLQFVGIDIKRAPDGRWVFLELNSSPIYLDVEWKLGHPISRAIAKLICAAP